MYALLKSTRDHFVVIKKDLLDKCESESQRRLGFAYSFDFVQKDDKDGRGFYVYEDGKLLAYHGKIN